MGDIAIIFCKSDKTKEISPAIYLHWSGDKVAEYLFAAEKRMRQGDVSYATARLIGILHEKIKGNLSLGVFSVDFCSDKYEEQLKELKMMSSGDAGVFTVDIDTGKVEHIEGTGYGFNDKKIRVLELGGDD